MKNRKKQYLRSLKLAKKLAAVAMLSATLAGASTSLVKLTSSTAYAAEQSNRKIEKIPFKTETKEDPTLPKGEKKVIQKRVEGEKEIVTTIPSESQSKRKPVDVIVPYDVSGSTYGGTSELDHLEAVAKQGADDTRYLIIGYDEGNTPDGFALRKVEKGATDSETKTTGARISKVTRFLSKQEVLTFVKKVRELLPASHQDGSWSWDKAMKALKYYDPQYMDEDGSAKDLGTPYEEIFEKGRDKNKAVGILWFTDDWEGWEKYDTSFFEWAQKNHADQFLTVVYGGTNSLSYNTLTKAGQKAILTTAGKDQTALANEIAEKFTKLVTITTPGKPTTSEKVIKEPVNEIIAIGTKAAEAKVTKRTEKIPFNTIIRENKDLEAGVKKVVHKGVEGEKEFVTTTTPDVEGKTGVAKGNVSFTTKASVTTSNEIKPRSIFAIFDNSGSVHGGDDDRIRSSFIPLLETMGPNDQIQIATYGINQKTSYYSNGLKDKERMVTKMMNREEFAKLAEDAMKGGTTREAIEANKLVYDFKGVKDSGSGYEFEDIFDAARNKDYTPVVMQFTDSWEYEEEIDSSFAEWSKSHAKTFMSVIYGSGRAEVAMKKAGHPNIFLATGEFTKDSDQTKKVLEQIKATTTEVVKKGANQTVKVSIGGQGVTVTKATLKGTATKELPVKDGKVEFSEALADGSYTIEYEASGNGALKTTVTVDGKEAANKTDNLKSEAGQKGSSNTAENIIKQPEDEIIEVGTKPKVEKEKIPYQTTEEEDPTLAEGERKVKVKGVEGLKTTTTSYTLDTKTGEVTPSVKTDEEPKTDEVILVGTKGSKSETSEKKIPFETIIEKDPELDEGVEKVVREGVEGLIKITTTYDTQKGVKVEGSEKSTEEVVTERVDKIVHVGTKKKAAQVKLRFIDQKSNKSLKDDEIVTNDKSKFGDEFSLKPEKELKVGKDLYRLVEIKLTDAKEDSKIEGLSEDKKSLTSKVTEAEQSYDAVYERVVYTSYVDENGKELDKTVEGAQEKKEIKGYDFVKTEKSDNGDVKHIYRAKPIKGKTPVKYAETNEKSGVMYSILGLIGAAALAESIRRKKQSK